MGVARVLDDLPVNEIERVHHNQDEEDPTAISGGCGGGIGLGIQSGDKGKPLKGY